jgi:hypothetical protein
MKRLLVALGLLISTNCFAGTVSVSPWISSNDVTIAHLETERQTFQNVLNGNIEGGAQNIRQGSITSYDLATAINPVTFRDEAFNDFTYTGMLPPTSASLSSTTTAGVSYVNGVRVETSATAHTYTASKDTYVYINAGGYFEYSEVANGASATTTPANSLLLAKVVTSGTAVTSVADLRTTSIQITANNANFPTNHRDQASVSRDTTTNFYVAPGSIAIGSSNYTNTSVSTTKSIITGTNWIEGSYPSGYNGLVFVYGYNNSGTAFDFKFSSADVAYSDTSANTGGVKRYYSNDGTYYRALGWAYLSADTVQLYHTSNLRDDSVYSSIEYTSTTSINTTSATFVNDSGCPMLRFYSSGGKVRITYNAGIASGTSQPNYIGLMIDNIDIADTVRQATTSNTTTYNYNTVTQWQGILARGMHSIQPRYKVDGGTGYINSRSIIIEEI